MRAIDRRSLLALGPLAALCAAAGFAIGGQGARDRAEAVIAEVFGKDIAEHAETEAFLDAFEDYLERTGNDPRDGIVDRIKRLYVQHVPVGLNFTRELEEDFVDSVIEKFATSTNVVRIRETGEDLVFVALFDPYEAPCGNQLNSINAP